MRNAWDPALPSRHQCYVTALVVRAFRGGTILKGTIKGEVVFYNRLPSGREVDLTADQYGGTPPTPVCKNGKPVDYSGASNPRFRRLIERVR